MLIKHFFEYHGFHINFVLIITLVKNPRTSGKFYLKGFFLISSPIIIFNIRAAKPNIMIVCYFKLLYCYLALCGN